MGLLGNDLHAEILKGLLSAREICLDGIQQSDDYQTIVKTRIIARQQHIVRVDRESRYAPEAACHPRAVAQFEAMLPDLDAVVIEDYAKGFLTQDFVDQIGALARRAGKIVTVDPNPRNDLRWTGVTAVKPNRGRGVSRRRLPDRRSDRARPRPIPPCSPRASGSSRNGTPRCCSSPWANSACCFSVPASRRTRSRPCFKEVFDVSGAGDTAIALFTLALAAGPAPNSATDIANHASGVVVGKLGTATLTPEELLASFERPPATGRG